MSTKKDLTSQYNLLGMRLYFKYNKELLNEYLDFNRKLELSTLFPSKFDAFVNVDNTKDGEEVYSAVDRSKNLFTLMSQYVKKFNKDEFKKCLDINYYKERYRARMFDKFDRVIKKKKLYQFNALDCILEDAEKLLEAKHVIKFNKIITKDKTMWAIDSRLESFFKLYNSKITVSIEAVDISKPKNK